MAREHIAIACALWEDEYESIPNIRQGACTRCETPIVISRSSDLVLGESSAFIVEAFCNQCTAKQIVTDLGLA